MNEKPRTTGNLALQDRRVIVIEATERPEKARLRVAAYARVSSDSSDQLNSFMAQTNYYTMLIASKEDWTLADIYADEGISGTSAEKRPDFQRLLSDCRKGRVDKILVKSISRFARNAKECLETVRALKDVGVGVCFEEQNIDTSNMSGELLTAVFAAIAQKESESISENMRWSYQQRMKSGTFLPAAMPFGYVIKDHKIEIDGPRAEIVRRVFSGYLAGMSMDEIAAQLDREKVPVQNEASGHKWTRSAIAYILSNERYIGDSLWQKTYATDTLPARQVRNHGEREKYYAVGTHPPIIEKEVFLAAQELRRKRNEKVSTGCSGDPMLRKLFCGHCGTMFRRKVCGGKTYWACRGHNRDRESCPVTQILEGEIHAAFLRLYYKLKLHGEPILTRMLSDLQTIRERKMLWRMDIVELNKRISDLSDQNRMLADMNKHGLVDSDIFISQSNELAQQLQAAKREKERLLGSVNDEIVPKTRELLEVLDALPEYLPAFNGEIFNDLVDRIIVDSNDTLRFRLYNGLELIRLSVLCFALADFTALFLHHFPCGAVNYRCMHILEHDPIFTVIFNAFFQLVRLGIGFEVQDVSAIFLQGEYFDDGGAVPLGRRLLLALSGALNAFLEPISSRSKDAVLLQPRGDLLTAKAIQRHGVDAPHDGGGLIVHDPAFRVVRVFHVPVGRLPHRFAGVAFDLIADAAFLADVTGIPLVEKVFYRRKLIISLKGVDAV